MANNSASRSVRRGERQEDRFTEKCRIDRGLVRDQRKEHKRNNSRCIAYNPPRFCVRLSPRFLSSLRSRSSRDQLSWLRLQKSRYSTSKASIETRGLNQFVRERLAKFMIYRALRLLAARVSPLIERQVCNIVTWVTTPVRYTNFFFLVNGIDFHVTCTVFTPMYGCV